VGDASWRAVLRPSAALGPQTLEPTRIVLERRSRAAGANAFPGSGHALLVGYTASPLRPAGASADWPRGERGIVVLPVEAVPADASRGERRSEVRQEK
jgi:hypothetical protein